MDSASFDTFRPFNMREHGVFIDALERFGSNNSGSEWQKIADTVGDRTVTEVQLHSHQYFLRLQAMTQGDYCAPIPDGEWTMSDDAAFETALASYEEGDSKRWAKIAAKIPGKTEADVKLRYQRLLNDLWRIEAGQQVTVRYSGYGTRPPTPGPPNIAGGRGRGNRQSSRGRGRGRGKGKGRGGGHVGPGRPRKNKSADREV